MDAQTPAPKLSATATLLVTARRAPWSWNIPTSLRSGKSSKGTLGKRAKAAAKFSRGSIHGIVVISDPNIGLLGACYGTAVCILAIPSEDISLVDLGRPALGVNYSRHRHTYIDTFDRGW